MHTGECSFLHRGGHEGEERTFRPQLTSLVDVMTILLVFLIKSFSVEGDLITPLPGLDLPHSTSLKPPSPLVSVEISQAGIGVDGELVVASGDSAGGDSLLLAGLYEHLAALKDRSSDTTAAGLMIQSDREIEFALVKRVLYTCGRAGFSDFSLLVLREE